jgi:two-component system, response regulator RegA
VEYERKLLTDLLSEQVINKLMAILMVDDDEVFCQVMHRALVRRGYEVEVCLNIASAERALQQRHFQKAIVDLKIAQESGLVLLKSLKAINPDIEIIMLTGYSSVSTAVEAIKLGALNYFCKPIGVDEILNAFTTRNVATENLASISTPTLDRVEWEHIQKILQDHHGNVSAAARTLGMHRRTLQRKLQKRPVSQ